MYPSNSILLTDAYQIAMLQAFRDHGMNETAAFEFFVRKMPNHRNFLLAAGLEQVVEFLETLHFTAEELEWLADCGLYRKDFVHSLEDMKFSGEVHAMPEGTVFFADEPVLRIVAPIQEAQLVETRVINLLQYQILIAS